MELVIDQKETALKKHFEGRKNTKVEVLEVGDIAFRKAGETIYVIERKSVTDLAASICDGRAREQKLRLLSSGVGREKIMYLVEGNLGCADISKRVGSVDVNTILGSMINTLLRDGISVYKTESIKETCVFVEKLHEKLEKDGTKYWQWGGGKEITSADYSSALKTRKKDNMDGEMWFITSLSLIPQVTAKVAAEIHRVYPTFLDLLAAYGELEDKEASKLLQDITYPINGGKTRKVGPKMSASIHKFLTGQN